MKEHPDCPFCGSGNNIIDTFNYPSGKPAKFRVQCQGCLAATHWCDTADEAWAAWDKRAKATKAPKTPKTSKTPKAPKRGRGRPPKGKGK